MLLRKNSSLCTSYNPGTYAQNNGSTYCDICLPGMYAGMYVLTPSMPMTSPNSLIMCLPTRFYITGRYVNARFVA